MQAVLELLDVPFVGTRRRACRRAWDKPTAKADSPAPAWTRRTGSRCPHTTFRELGAQACSTRWSSGSVCRSCSSRTRAAPRSARRWSASPAELPAAMVSCLAYADTVLAERFVDGVEVAVVGRRGRGARRARCPPSRSRPKGGVYDYTARYTPGATTFHCPARLDDAVADALADRARRAPTARTARRLPDRRDRRRRRSGAVPGGQRVPGDDRHVAVANGGGR